MNCSSLEHLRHWVEWLLQTSQILRPAKLSRTLENLQSPQRFPARTTLRTKSSFATRILERVSWFLSFYLNKKILVMIFMRIFINAKFNCLLRPMWYPVMGIKGRRVHIIEEMSSCVISFQRGKKMFKNI